MIPGAGQVQSFELSQALMRELRPGERIVWSGQPVPKAMRRGAWLASLFAIPFTAIAVTWVVFSSMGTWFSSRNDGPEWPAAMIPCFGLPFVLVGVMLLLAPIWMGRAAYRTLYTITDQRAIVLRRRWLGAMFVQSFAPDQLASLERHERSDGMGDLIFQHDVTRSGTSVVTVRRGFIGVPNVAEVERILSATLLHGRTRAI